MVFGRLTSRRVPRLINKNFFDGRCLCKYFSVQSSSEIRKGFINYFINKDHKFVKSSPVVPLCDPSVAFVNAGMNQFKGVFLGQFSPPHYRVVNSQKCIRVGGKHNDLSVVGTDGYHHTFFEMLGNWSFADYYKEDACRMAWDLIVNNFRIDPNRLVVTYFDGDKQLDLDADDECKDIWRRIGVKNENIVAGSAADNFWEMGPTGPCGPCTELHYKKDDGSLMEIWNIVFIQFNRNLEGVVEWLPKSHIDTGMGLERMTALLQNKNSNYDTDLFLPIIKTIYKESGKGVLDYSGSYGKTEILDTAYRTLADHARMISVCLADGVFPSRNLRLRNILRKSFSLSNNIFKSPPGLICTLYDKVTEILGDAYPELDAREKEAKRIIEHEQELMTKLEKNIKKQKRDLLRLYPETEHLSFEFGAGYTDGYKHFKQEMKNLRSNSIPGSLAFKLYDTFGIRESAIEQIAQINNLGVDMDSFQEHLHNNKTKHKAVITETTNRDLNLKLNLEIDKLVNDNNIKTDDRKKYSYSFKNGALQIPQLQSKLIAIFSHNGESLNEINVESEDDKFHLVFDETNFYCEEGGQANDIGQITIGDETFKVTSAKKVNNLVLHSGTFVKRSSDQNFRLKIGECGRLSVDSANRLLLMQHHTATHLLNAALKKVLPDSVICQHSSKVKSSGLTFELGVYGTKLTEEALIHAQELVRMACSQDTPVAVQEINVQQLLEMGDVTTVPGEIYPETGMRLVEISLLDPDSVFSRELCCGTHVPSTNLIEDFVIISAKNIKSPAPVIRAVAGSLAKKIRKINADARVLYQALEYNDVSDKAELQEQINKMRNELNDLCNVEGAGFGVRADCIQILDSVEKKIKNKDAKSLVDLVKSEMGVTYAENAEKPFIVHFLVCSYLLEPTTLSLYSAVECVLDKPILILGCACGIIKATCHVPESFVTTNFTAEKWIESIVGVFGTNVAAPAKNQDMRTLAHMNGKKVSQINCESLVADAIKTAKAFARQHLGSSAQPEEKSSKEQFNGDSDSTKIRGQST